MQSQAGGGAPSNGGRGAMPSGPEVHGAVEQDERSIGGRPPQLHRASLEASRCALRELVCSFRSPLLLDAKHSLTCCGECS